MIKITASPLEYSLNTYANGLQCPNCTSHKIKRNGKQNGIQKFKCKHCNKNFRETTDTSIHHIHRKEKLSAYIECMYNGMSLRRSAKQTGISLATAFAWRHKILCSFTNKYPLTKSIKNITAIHTQHRNNEKEKSILLLEKDKVVHIKKVSTKFDIIKLIGGEPNIIVNDKTLQKYNNTNDSKLKQRIHKTSTYYNQEMHNWVNKFKNITPRYLQQYWNWFILNEKLIDINKPTKEIISRIVTQPSTYNIYKKL